MDDKPTPDEDAGDDAAERLGDQTPVYPVTKVTQRKPPAIHLDPVLTGGNRMILSSTQLGCLLDTRNILLAMRGNATDGAEELAAQFGHSLDRLLDRYPHEVKPPRPPKGAAKPK